MTIIRLLLSLSVLTGLCGLAQAAPPPPFATPEALLEGIYAEITASNDWENYDHDKGFDPHDTFSTGLKAELAAADAIVNPTGEYMGALDFSPFIHGQDSGGLTFDIAAPVSKRGRASSIVSIMLDGELLHAVRVEMVEEPDGWKVDDFLLSGDGTAWWLSDYLADPLNF
jgi:hypothetical protein